MQKINKKSSDFSFFKEELSSGAYSKISRMLNGLAPSDIADLLESSPPRDREVLWQLLYKDNEGEVLNSLSDPLKESFLLEMDAIEVIEITETLEPDELADILQRLPETVSNEVLSVMSEQNRKRLELVLSYPEDTAGGLMNTDIIAIRTSHTLEVVLRYLRMQENLPSSTDNLYVVTKENKFKGSLPISTLLTSDPTMNVGDVYDANHIPIMATESENEVSRLFEKKDLISAPVIDEENNLLGRITIDDVVDVIKEEADESLRQLTGLEEDTFAKASVATKNRALWLGINLITAFIAAFSIDLFKDTIQELVTLAVLMPIVASMGGVAATQTLTIMVRGMAMNQINRSNIRWLITRETIVGLCNGLIWALVVSLIAVYWFDDFLIAKIIGIAMIINLLIAVISGSAVPIILKILKIDPGIGGAVIVTTITDVSGFVSFLGLATLYLH
ncbi:MAG: magnesium transporter [SAR86 cluster bacterium]|nr:magnesium transporter [SAR86 cluster bacterium]